MRAHKTFETFHSIDLSDIGNLQDVIKKIGLLLTQFILNT